MLLPCFCKRESGSRGSTCDHFIFVSLKLIQAFVGMVQETWKIFPGLSIFLGSSAIFNFFIRAHSSGVLLKPIKSRFINPIPCSAEIDPPRPSSRLNTIFSIS